MNQQQLDSFVRTALKIAGAILMQHGLTTQAAWLNSPDVCGLVVLLAGLWLSHQKHSPAVAGPAAECSPIGGVPDLPGRSSQPAQQATGTPPEPADKKVCATPVPDPSQRGQAVAPASTHPSIH